MAKKIVLFVLLVAVVVTGFIIFRKHQKSSEVAIIFSPGHDTPIVIAGGSIHAQCDVQDGCPAWTVVPTDSTSYTATLSANIRHIVLTDTADAEKYRVDIPNRVADDWRIEISHIDMTDPANPKTTPKAITIMPDLIDDTSGKTLKITITKKPTSYSKWDEFPHLSTDPLTEIRFRGNPKACQSDGSADDSLGHCDKLSTIQVFLTNKPQPEATCQTSSSDGKCKLKLKMVN